jgi:hypothetical protein
MSRKKDKNFQCSSEKKKVILSAKEKISKQETFLHDILAIH